MQPLGYSYLDYPPYYFAHPLDTLAHHHSPISTYPSYRPPLEDYQLRLREYEDELRFKQSFPEAVRREQLYHQDYFETKEEQAMRLAHIHRLERLQRQRNLLQLGTPIRHYDDEALVQSYATGVKAEEYQRQLQQKMISSRKYQESPQQDNRVGQLYASHQHGETSRKKANQKEGNEVGKDKGNRSGDRQEDPSPQSQKPHGNSNLTNGSFKNDAIARKMQEQSSSVLNRSDDSPLKGIYRTGDFTSSRKKISKRGRSVHSLNATKVILHGPPSSTQDAFKRIENRLRVASIVYKDSKLRNWKHEMAHLRNTYENEMKGRREVKEKINSNPSILRKHAMVVE